MLTPPPTTLTTPTGASRILQALSRDNLLGDWFLFFSKEKGEPIRAILFSWICVQGVVAIGAVRNVSLLSVAGYCGAR